MKDFPFVWTEQTPLSTELSRPIDYISVMLLNSWLMQVTLWRSDGTGIRVHSEMIHVAERTEVGVLHFSFASEFSPEELFAKIEPTFGLRIAVFKLIIAESGANVESGLILAADSGDEIVIVANAFPCRLAIRGVPSILSSFEPEYPLDEYTRALIS
jgi:hypothetical protein